MVDLKLIYSSELALDKPSIQVNTKQKLAVEKEVLQMLELCECEHFAFLDATESEHKVLLSSLHVSDERCAHKEEMEWLPKAIDSISRGTTPYGWRHINNFGQFRLDIFKAGRQVCARLPTSIGRKLYFGVVIKNDSVNCQLIYPDLLRLGVYCHVRLVILSTTPCGDQYSNSRLSKRQLQCLQWVSVGKSDWEIGRILGISQHTVHRHIEGAKKKLNVSTRVQAVIAAGVNESHQFERDKL